VLQFFEEQQLQLPPELTVPPEAVRKAKLESNRLTFMLSHFEQRGGSLSVGKTSFSKVALQS